MAEFKLAHVLCPKSNEVCHRLGIRGFPTISVLDGDRVYDYQGKLTVANLSKFVTNKVYKEKSRPRLIRHVTSPWENFSIAVKEMNLKMRAFAMLMFRAFGLGHLEEEFVIQVVMMAAIVPMVLLMIALAIERRIIENKKKEAAAANS